MGKRWGVLDEALLSPEPKYERRVGEEYQEEDKERGKGRRARTVEQEEDEYKGIIRKGRRGEEERKKWSKKKKGGEGEQGGEPDQKARWVLQDPEY